MDIEHIPDYSMFKYTWPDSEQLNESLKEVIFQEEQETATKVASGVHTWISQFTQEWRSDVTKLVERVNSMLEACTDRDKVDELWAVIYRDGAYFHPHTHPRALWSGIYYVDPGNRESGHTVFVKDRTQMPTPDRTEWGEIEHYTVAPKAGLMVIFPSTLLHYVEVYEGESPRIVVPFNAGYVDDTKD